MLLGKDKLSTIEVLISKSFIDSYISHGEFVSVNNVLREYNENTNKNFCAIYYIKTMKRYCVNCKKHTTNKNSNARKTKQNRLILL